MTLNDVLTNNQTGNVTSGRCTRCGRTDVLGWSPQGLACGPCARDIYRANMQLAMMTDVPSVREPMPAWAVILMVKLIVFLLASLYWYAR